MRAMALLAVGAGTSLAGCAAHPIHWVDKELGEGTWEISRSNWSGDHTVAYVQVKSLGNGDWVETWLAEGLLVFPIKETLTWKLLPDMCPDDHTTALRRAFLCNEHGSVLTHPLKFYEVSATIDGPVETNCDR
jgi:hypothetical protein